MNRPGAELEGLARLREMRERRAAAQLAAQRDRCTALLRQTGEAQQRHAEYRAVYERQRNADWQLQIGHALDYQQLQALQDRERQGQAELQALFQAWHDAQALQVAAEQACAGLFDDYRKRQRQVQALSALRCEQKQISMRQCEALAELNSEDIPHHAAYR